MHHDLQNRAGSRATIAALFVRPLSATVVRPLSATVVRPLSAAAASRPGSGTVVKEGDLHVLLCQSISMLSHISLDPRKHNLGTQHSAARSAAVVTAAGNRFAQGSSIPRISVDSVTKSRVPVLFTKS